MSTRSAMAWMVALAALTGGRAWAAGGTGGAAGALSVGPTQPATTTSSAATTASSSGVISNAPVSTNANALPPPPPTSVNPTASSANTIPPTPAPATAGLPSTPGSPVLPSQQGLSAATTNEGRPSPSLNADQVVNVQAALAAGGLYRGPIDGNMSASLRASIRQFQQISGLPQTGDLDAQTATVLQHGAVAGSAGSNGTTSTAGNLGVSQPFIFTNVPAATSTATGTATFSTPFQLSAPINTSPSAPSGLIIQP